MSNRSSASGSGSDASVEAPPPPPLSDLAKKLETKLKKQDTANKDAFARKLKEEEVRHFHPMADIIAERLISPKLLSEVRPIFHDFMLLRLSLRRMDKMLAAVGRQNRRINKAVTRRRKIARSYVKVAPSPPTSASTSSAPSLASGPQPVALSARQTRFLALKLEQVSQLEARLSAFIGSHPADTLSRPFTQYLQWQKGELANARKKIDAYGKDRGTGGTVSKSKASDSPLSGTPTSPPGSNSGNSTIVSPTKPLKFPQRQKTNKKGGQLVSNIASPRLSADKANRSNRNSQGGSSYHGSKSSNRSSQSSKNSNQSSKNSNQSSKNSNQSSNGSSQSSNQTGKSSNQKSQSSNHSGGSDHDDNQGGNVVNPDAGAVPRIPGIKATSPIVGQTGNTTPPGTGSTGPRAIGQLPHLTDHQAPHLNRPPIASTLLKHPPTDPTKAVVGGRQLRPPSEPKKSDVPKDTSNKATKAGHTQTDAEKPKSHVN